MMWLAAIYHSRTTLKFDDLWTEVAPLAETLSYAREKEEDKREEDKKEEEFAGEKRDPDKAGGIMPQVIIIDLLFKL